jgi:hypothetical protein
MFDCNHNHSLYLKPPFVLFVILFLYCMFVFKLLNCLCLNMQKLKVMNIVLYILLQDTCFGTHILQLIFLPSVIISFHFFTSIESSYFWIFNFCFLILYECTDIFKIETYWTNPHNNIYTPSLSLND